MAANSPTARLSEDDEQPRDTQRQPVSDGLGRAPQLGTLTTENVRARTAGDQSRMIEDDAFSVQSAYSRQSTVSYQPSRHALQRSAERSVTVQEIKSAKALGSVALCLKIAEEDSTSHVQEEICGWARRLEEVFPQIVPETPGVRGAWQHSRTTSSSGVRLQMDIAESEGLGKQIKTWLKSQGFFMNPARRILYHHNSLMVVEGLTRDSDIEVITVFEKSQNQSEILAQKLPTGLWLLEDPELKAFHSLKNSLDRFLRDPQQISLIDVLQEVKNHPRLEGQWANMMSWAVLDLTKTDGEVPCRTLAGFQRAIVDRGWLQADQEKFPSLREYMSRVKRLLPSSAMSSLITVRVFTNFLAYLAVLCCRLRRPIRWDTIEMCKEPLYEEILGALTQEKRTALENEFSKHRPRAISAELMESQTRMAGEQPPRLTATEGEDDRHGGEIEAVPASPQGGGAGQGEGCGGGRGGNVTVTPRHTVNDMMKIVRTIPRFWDDVHAGNESFESARIRNQALHDSLRGAIEALEMALTEALASRPSDHPDLEQARLSVDSIKGPFFESDWSSISMGTGQPSNGVTSWEVNPSSFEELKSVAGFVNLIHTRLEYASDYDLLEDFVDSVEQTDEMVEAA